MWTREQQNRAAKIFLRRLGLLALALLVIAAGWGVAGVWGKDMESKQLREQAENQLNDLSTRKTALESDLSKMQTDRGKEEILRTQYALAQKGEGLIVIVDPSSTTSGQSTSTVFDTIRHLLWPW